MKRRTFLGAGALAMTGFATGGRLGGGIAHAQVADMRLRAGVLRRKFEGIAVPSPMWGFNESVPGPELRFRKGDKLAIAVANALPVATTVHWHGLRVPNAMDGVPGVTQPAIRPGETFRYAFDLPDSGTFWYHPHQKSFEQVGRGLYGAFIVEEEKPIEVDRDLTWVLGDFKIDPASGAHGRFDDIGEHAASGRLGNVLTINGKAVGADTALGVRRGERLRLRLINAATARVFRLAFAGHEPWVVAFDGQGVVPHRAGREPVLLGPGMRVDLVIDFLADPGGGHAVTDTLSGAVLAPIAYAATPPLRATALGAAMSIQRNDLPRPDLKKAVVHTIEFKGGAAGPPVIAMVDGKPISLRDMQNKYGLAWTVNSHAAHEEAHEHTPLLVLKRGSSHVLTMVNTTGFVHPIHLHGHFFRVLSYNGTPPAHEEWRDTVFMEPWDEVTIGFVAGEPGDWMFHCHILEHAAAGMMGVIRVE